MSIETLHACSNGYDSIATKCLRALSDLFSPNLIDQSSCRMGLALACVMRILHEDWSIRLGENRFNMALKHLAAMMVMTRQYVFKQALLFKQLVKS